MRPPLRRVVCGAVLTILVIVVTTLALLHLGPVQRAIWDTTAERISATTGWDIRLDGVRFRLWPARLAVHGVSVTAPGAAAPLLEAERVGATWRWASLLGTPRRLRTLEITGLGGDTSNLPSAPPASPEPPPRSQWWPEVAIDDLRLSDSRLLIPTNIVDFRLVGVRLSGTLSAGRGIARVWAAEVEATREGRRLALGSLQAGLEATPTGLIVERASLAADHLRIDARADIEPVTRDQVVRATFDIESVLADVIRWWDPPIADRLEPAGTVTSSGSLRWSTGSGLELTANGSGDGVRLAGYAVETFRIETPTANSPMITASDPLWGRLTVGPLGGGAIPVSALLDTATVDPLRSQLPGEMVSRIPRSAVASGTVDAVIPFPFDLDELDATVDLRLGWPRGEIAIGGAWHRGRATAERLAISLAGIVAVVAGSAAPADTLDITATAAISDPALLLAELRRWVDLPDDLNAGGGAAHLTASVSGPWANPEIAAELRWNEPHLAGRELAFVAAGLQGTLTRAAWTLDAKAPGVTGDGFGASGSVSIKNQTLSGDWTLARTRAGALASLAVPAQYLPIGGRISATGSLGLGPSGWTASAGVAWQDASWAEWRADRIEVQLDLSPGKARLQRLSLERDAGIVVAQGEVTPLSSSGRIDLRLTWAYLTPAMIPFAAPAALDGAMSGSATIAGTVDNPTLSSVMLWNPASQPATLGPLTVAVQVEDGTLDVTSLAFATRGGPARFEATVPLGELPKPRWLWVGAPAGPATFAVFAERIDVVPLVEAFGPVMPGLSVRTGISLEGRWHPDQPEVTLAVLRLTDFEADLGREVLRGVRPIVARLEGRAVTLERSQLVGAKSDANISGTIDLDAGTFDIKADAAVAPAIAEMFSPIIAVRRPIAVTADLKGPLRSPTGHIHVTHDGTIAITDPPVEIKDVDIEVTLTDGVIDVDQGSASVNGGSIRLAGGWNPAQEQGVVFQIDDVTFILPYGIISQWDGLVAIEPRPQGRMAIVGELTLDHGLLDRPFDFTAAFLPGAPSEPTAPDSLLALVDLDLDVIGRGKILVDNNLGQLKLQWQRLTVRGTVDEPVLEGQIRILPEGALLLTGSRVGISRGTIDFSGEYGAEPQVEIITAQPLLGSADTGSTQSVDYARIAQVGLLRSVGKVFGLEDSRIEPIDIASETDSNPGNALSIARVISDHAVLFLTTDLTEVQRQTTMLQLYKWTGLPGFALQVFSSSQIGVGDGAAVLYRYQFGGTAARDDTRPRVAKVRIEGDWPVSKRALRKATQLEKGQTFDPFLLFVGQVRLEQALAAQGYPEAEVTGKIVGETIEPTLEFRVDPGPHYTVRFTGLDLPRQVKERIRGKFRPGPLAAASLDDMRRSLLRELAVIGYPKAAVDVAVKAADITLAVEPGPEIVLEGLELPGVPADVERRTRAQMASPAILAALADNDPDAVRRLQQILVTQGYATARVVTTGIAGDDDRDEHLVRAVVELGPQASVATVTIEGGDPLNIRARPGFPLDVGMPLRGGLVDAAVRFLRNTYRDAGYPDVEAHAKIRFGDDGGTVVIALATGEKITVDEITVTGLRHLKESVVRKGAEIKTGKPLRLSQLDATVANIASFSPVAKVELLRHDRGTRTAIEIAIEEKLRWTIGAGIRWNSETGEEILLDLRDNDLLGRGLGANVRGHYGSKSKAGQFYLSLPPPPGGRVSFGGGASFSEVDSSGDVSEKTALYTVDGTLHRGREGLLRAYLQRERTRREDASPGPESPALSITTLATVGGQVISDRRNDPFNPTRGWYGTVDASYSPKWLGSDNQVFRTLATYTRADPIGRRWMLAQGVRLGGARAYGGPLPLTSSARFFAGGENTIRGFLRDSVGPSEIGADADGNPVVNYLGGGALLILNEEIRYILSDRFVLAAFADSGQVWSSWSDTGGELAVGAGLGLRVLTPVGPLRFDIAWPAVNAMGQTGPRYYVGIGQPF